MGPKPNPISNIKRKLSDLTILDSNNPPPPLKKEGEGELGSEIDGV